MKFRADESDVKKFVIFLVILLYFCAIFVVNISYFASEGEFYGFSPFLAFTPGYIGSTFTLFGLAVVAILASSKSFFFDREKGFGFTMGKKDKGYSRWCKDKEMKATLAEVDPHSDKFEHAGIAVINDGKKLWVDDGEAHNVIIGATGSGKTQIVVFPMIKTLCKAGESMILTDPKGELYEETGEMLRAHGYDVILLNFRDPQKGSAWNPMTLPYTLYKDGNTDKAIELLDDLALNILYDEKGGGSDPFWEKSAADYFSGLALGLFEDASESQINLNSLNLMSTLGEERYGAPNNNYMKEYFNGKDPSKPAYVNASGTVFAPDETKGGVLSTFKQKVKLFSSRDNLSEMLSHSDFDMHDIGKRKTAVFLIVQDEKKTLHPLATIFIKQCYETLIDVAQVSGGHLPYRTNFILDEFANMPPLKDVTTMVTAARSRHIRFTFIIQNFAQLTKVYGKEDAETIKGNCNILYLISSELQALEELSKMCGEVKSKEKDKTASTPLVTVSDLQRMKQFEVIWLRLRMMPFKTKLTPNFKMKQESSWGKEYPKAGYIEREKTSLDLFDIREFVKAKKKEKMNDIDKMLGSGGSKSNPFDDLFGPSKNSNSEVKKNPFDDLFGPSKDEKTSSDSSSFDDLFSPSKSNSNDIVSDNKSSLDLLSHDNNDNVKVSSNISELNSSVNHSSKLNSIDDILSGNSNSTNDTFNVDDVVKMIDAKIAELEEEEKKENEEKNSGVISDNNFGNNTISNSSLDDDFFDDFFSDD